MLKMARRFEKPMPDLNTPSPKIQAKKLAAIYAAYLEDPGQVESEWAKVFLNLDEQAN